MNTMGETKIVHIKGENSKKWNNGTITDLCNV